MLALQVQISIEHNGRHLVVDAAQAVAVEAAEIVVACHAVEAVEPVDIPTREV
jgi:hypothetical protein